MGRRESAYCAHRRRHWRDTDQVHPNSHQRRGIIKEGSRKFQSNRESWAQDSNYDGYQSYWRLTEDVWSFDRRCKVRSHNKDATDDPLANDSDGVLRWRLAELQHDLVGRFHSQANQLWSFKSALIHQVDLLREVQIEEFADQSHVHKEIRIKREKTTFETAWCRRPIRSKLG